MVADRTAVVLGEFPRRAGAVEHVLTNVGVTVVGKALTPEAGLSLVRQRRPDLLVVDIDTLAWPIAATELVRRACALVPGLKVIALSAEHDGERIDAILKAGAEAYVVKTARPEDVATAFRQAFEHSIYFAPAPVEPAFPRLQAVAEPRLSARELEILGLVAEGKANAAVAAELGVKEQTVKFHLSNVYRKIGASNRTEASRWLQVKGLALHAGRNRRSGVA